MRRIKEKNKIRDLLKRRSNFMKYFLSYFLILAIMLSCFLLVLTAQLRVTYTEHLTDKRSMHIGAVSDQFDTNVGNLTRIQSSLMTDMDLNFSQYSTLGWYQYRASQCITRYTVGNEFIDSICYYDEKFNFTLSTGRHVKRTEKGFEIYNGTKYLSFDIEKLTDTPVNQLIYLPDSSRGLLLFFPAQNSLSKRLIFYVISNNALRDILGSGVANDISALAFVTPDKDIVSGVNTQQMEESLRGLTFPFTELTVHENGKLFVSPQNQSGLYLVAYGTNEGVLPQLFSALQKTILIFLCIVVFGVIVILLVMRFTYWPLQRLIHKHLPKADESEGYINQLDSAFTKVHTENEALHEKVDRYKDLMVKSTLNTIVTGDDVSELNKDFDIDTFFTMEPDNQLYVILLKGEKETTPELMKNLKELLEASLPGKRPCVVLNAKNDIVILIIQYTGIEPDKEAALISLLHDYHEESGAYIAVSDYAISPLEISLLYKHACTASSYWNSGKTVVSYHDISSDTIQDPAFEYPYSQLENFASALRSQAFDEAKIQLDEFFDLIDQTAGDDSPFPDFYTRCILIDILSAIINNMDRFQVKFQTYNKLYFEALYLCRTCSYTEKREEIRRNMQSLIDTYKEEYNAATIHPDEIVKEINENYTSPDFSIFVLADKFTVSTAYMSYLCKKELGTHFSAYLWQLRMKKAVELMRKTDMTIENISEAVGYINTSSFRRKFKQETGKTPSQIRRELNESGLQG